MTYEERMRFRAKLQRLGLPAILDELVRLDELATGLAERVGRLEGRELGPCSDLGSCTCPADREVAGLAGRTTEQAMDVARRLLDAS